MISSESIDTILTSLKRLGIEKLNIVGGEPMMHPLFYDLLRLSKEMGFVVCVTTNGSFLNANTIRKMKDYVSWIGISVDSPSDKTAAEMGRGKGNHLAHIKKIAPMIHEAGIKLKINTVVTKQTKDEDMRGVIAELKPARWKVFQFLTIKGQNDHVRDEFAVTAEEFEKYCERHRTVKLEAEGKTVFPVFESAECMGDSYFMIDANGNVEVNTPDGAIYVPLSTVTSDNLAETLNLEKYIERGAIYDW